MATTRSFQIVLKQEQTNKFVYVNVSQAAASEAVYGFSANPTSIVLTPNYTTNQSTPTFANKTITVSSTKVYAGATTNPTYTSSISSTLATNLNVVINDATVTFSVKSIPTSNLTGTVTLRQNESNKTITINVSIQVSEFTAVPNSITMPYTIGNKTSTVTSKLGGLDASWNIQSTNIPSWLEVTKTNATTVTIKTTSENI